VTEGRGGTVALVIVIVVYALLFGAWYVTAGQVEPTPTPTPAPTATPTPTQVPSSWKGRFPTRAAIPTAGLLQPPLLSTPTPTPT
jgi:hypothetical protein